MAHKHIKQMMLASKQMKPLLWTHLSLSFDKFNAGVCSVSRESAITKIIDDECSAIEAARRAQQTSRPAASISESASAFAVPNTLPQLAQKQTSPDGIKCCA
jgi:hypothetical protein